MNLPLVMFLLQGGNTLNISVRLWVAFDNFGCCLVLLLDILNAFASLVTIPLTNHIIISSVLLGPTIFFDLYCCNVAHSATST